MPASMNKTVYCKRMSDYNPYVFVAGNACIEILSSGTHKNGTKSQLGHTHFGFGGTALNLAVNCIHKGLDVVYMGAFKESPLTGMVKAELAEQGVRLHTKHIKTEEVASSNTVLDTLSVLTLPPYKEALSTKFIERGLNNASAVLMDCALPLSTLESIVHLAQQNNIPLFIVEPHDMLAEKLLHLKKGVFEEVFLSEESASYLQGKADCYSHGQLAKHLDTRLIVTEGLKNISVCDGDNEKILKHTMRKCKGNTHGLTEFVAAVCVEQSFQDTHYEFALKVALNDAHQIVDSLHPNIGRNYSLEKNIEKLISKAQLDHLTQICNRDGIFAYYERIQPDEKDVTVIMIDIDHFKSVNDTYGHKVGDEALVQVAEILSECVRNVDLIGRWGGEEFVGIIKAPPKVAQNVAERMRASVESATFDNIPNGATISVGVASLHKYEELDIVLERADIALYEAKQTGRNKIVISK